MLAPGDRVTVDVGAVAHGGHCVARHQGQVLFVRHALPGETVVAHVTERRRGGRFVFADAVEILTPSPHRVTPPCRFAGPGRCGGCDFQHVSWEEQRRLKAGVVTEQLRRLGGIEWDVEVEPMPGDTDGLGWRTRMRFSVDGDGRAGLREHRSHRVEPLDLCAIADPSINASGVFTTRWPPDTWVEVLADAAGGSATVSTPGQPAPDRHEHVGSTSFQVSQGGFWQVHRAAASVLSDTVAAFVNPKPREHVVDLYAGVGLLAAAVAPALGPAGRLDAVESHPAAAADASANLAALGTAAAVQVHHARVEAFVASGSLRRCDAVVLDPPRRGARAPVVRAIAGWQPARVVYVACDPAALARDLATFATWGYRLADLRAYDMFPMTHHVETVALVVPA